MAMHSEPCDHLSTVPHNSSKNTHGHGVRLSRPSSIPSNSGLRWTTWSVVGVLATDTSIRSGETM
eukprot:3133360-Amphidinium_carterae.2